MKDSLRVIIVVLGIFSLSALGPDCDQVTSTSEPSKLSTVGEFCPDPDAYCIDLWDPVCGTDGITYSNDCYANEFGCVAVECLGECPCVPEPVCTDQDLDGAYAEPGCGPITDCNDNDPDNWESCDTCADGDGDGYFNNCDSYSIIPGPDCCGLDADVWVSCRTCHDSDHDGYWAGCDAYNIRTGIDCDDLDPNNWDSCQTCIDNDGDGYYVGCDMNPTGAGFDCEDYNGAINPGAVESACDGIDSDCDGSESNMSCTMEWTPVCGADGVTYSNECHANYFGCVTVECEGECPCIPDPVCTDNDGDGYYLESDCGTPVDCNDYYASINPGANDYACDYVDSDCDGMDSNIYCTMEWAPVCGMDGMTYSNDCHANYFGCTMVACQGVCPCYGGGGGNDGECYDGYCYDPWY
jgi:Kazal-type serine protease inhibitor-like protein/putative metal-binding protein